MTKSTMLAGVAALAFLSSTASAEVFVGDTTGGPTWNRPFTMTDLSAIGTDTPYAVDSFTVSADGSYDFLSTVSGWDNFLLLYEVSFDPLDQFTNLLALNDDFSGIGTSGFSFALSTGVTYLAVTTGYDNDDFGAYTLEVTGPGDVIPGDGGPSVPEPASWAMMLAGMGAIGYAMRHRRSVNVSFA